MITINKTCKWLTEWNDRWGVRMDIRILKLQEEVGEVADAYIGWTGQNPRKGVTHTLAEFHRECADVALSALVAIASTGGDAETVLNDKMLSVLKRLDGIEPKGSQMPSYPIDWERNH